MLKNVRILVLTEKKYLSSLENEVFCLQNYSRDMRSNDSSDLSLPPYPHG